MQCRRLCPSSVPGRGSALPRNGKSVCARAAAAAVIVIERVTTGHDVNSKLITESGPLSVSSVKGTKRKVRTLAGVG